MLVVFDEVSYEGMGVAYMDQWSQLILLRRRSLERVCTQILRSHGGLHGRHGHHVTAEFNVFWVRVGWGEVGSWV